MMNYRDYQLDIINKGSEILTKHWFVYLAMEVRTGKTLTSLGIAEKLGATCVLFVTKKKAIKSVEDDYKKLSPSFYMLVINYESLHKHADEWRWDIVIIDEAHSLGAFPKPNKRSKDIASIIRKYNSYVILLSGTPTPESYSQMYHQVNFLPNNPFKQYSTFYKFCKDYVKVREKMINGLRIRDYSNGNDSIIEAMKPYTISYSQAEAGFQSVIDEEVLYVDIEQRTIDIIAKLKKDLVVEGKDDVILADTPVKLMSKMHQLYSGTIKFESGNSMVIDLSKAEYIKKAFHNRRIGIFYKFKEELNALKQVYGDAITTDLDEFNTTDKNIALQIVSGREGISLRHADFLVYYNIDFSATSYWQSRDRMTTMERMNNKIYWVFSRGGIEDKIYKAVSKKKDYTVTHFKKDLLNL